MFADFGSRLYGPIDAYVPARRLGSHFIKEVRTPTFVNQYVVNQRHTHLVMAAAAMQHRITVSWAPR